MSKETTYTCSSCGGTDLFEGIGGFSCNDCDPEGNDVEEY